MKGEARILVYGVVDYYGVFATYRKNFIEELLVLRLQQGLDISYILRKQLTTYNEITYILPCNENKYSNSILGFRIIEGGEELLVREQYCNLIKQLICILNTRTGLIPSLGTISTSNKCPLTW